MTNTYHLVRNNPDINMAVGHHTVEVIVEERDGETVVGTGMMEKYGISTEELVARFDSDIEKWLAWVGREMLRKYKQRAGVQESLLSVRGTSAEIVDE